MVFKYTTDFMGGAFITIDVIAALFGDHILSLKLTNLSVKNLIKS